MEAVRAGKGRRQEGVDGQLCKVLTSCTLHLLLLLLSLFSTQ